ncbi:replication protein A 70 kDa DNA-binding subunit B-like protein [Tanacetum coccineum]
MRALLDTTFTEFLLKIGNGTETSHKNDLLNIPPSMLIKTHADKDPLDALVDCLPKHSTALINHPCSLNRAILTTKNSFVDEINEILIARFPGEETEYASFDETLDPNDQTQYEDFLHSLTPNGMPPHRLVLKPNSPIILLRNLNPTEGLCNGTRLICKDLKRNVIHAEIAFGDFAGKQVFIHRIPLQPPSDEDYTVPFKRVQFPIRLCFAMTIVTIRQFQKRATWLLLDIRLKCAWLELLVRGKMSRPISNVLDITPQIKRKWTVIIQVLESGHVQQSKNDVTYKRFIFTDSHGTKVGAVIYGASNIRLFSKLLMPYKRYYVSSAVVTRTDEKFRVSSYIYSWIINNKSLVEELVESIPTSLPCEFEFTKFTDLYKYADSESPQNVRGIVLHCFPSEEQGTPMITKRDIVIVNEEKKLLMLSLWNHFDENEGNTLAGMIGSGVMIFGMRLKVTTFNCLSLSTRGSSGLMIDPPVTHDLQMQEWYNANKAELEELLNKKSYKNSDILLPYPKDEDIISISTVVASLRTLNASWIKGKISLPRQDRSTWFTACANCKKSLEADLTWIVTCPLCHQESEVEALSRMTIQIDDGTTTLYATIGTPDVEKIVPYTAVELKDADEHGINLHDDIAASVQKHTIVAFIRSYEATFRGQAEMKVSVIKAYTLDEGPASNLISLQPENLEPEKQVFGSTSSVINPSRINLPEKESAKPESVAKPATDKDKQLFTPSTKLVLEEISSTVESKYVKRSLPFSNKDLDTQKTATLLAIKKEVGDEVMKGSPTKKKKDSKDS